MKTKFLLTAMVLPAVFAACTNEELMVEQNDAPLTSRAMLDQNFTINVVDDINSRFSWNEGTFGWNQFTANDKFGAALVDNGLPMDNSSWAVTNYPLTNYIYSTEDGAGYTTTSQMVEGAYLFYSYPGFENNAKRELPKFDLTKQTTLDLSKPTAAVEANQLFVAPMYKLNADNANSDLSIQFVSYWSTAAFAINNTSKSDLKIVRVILQSTGDDFNVKGNLVPETIKDKFMYAYDKEAGALVLPKDADGNRYTFDDFRTNKIATETDMVKSLALNCGSYVLEAGEDVTAYFQVPAGIYSNDLTFEIVAEYTPAVANATAQLVKFTVPVVKNAKSKEDKTANDRIKFTRGKTTSLMGIENGAVKAYEIDDISLLTADEEGGEYANSLEELAEIISGHMGSASVAATEAEIFNMGDLVMDDATMNLLKRLQKNYTPIIIFKNPIEISSASKNSVTNVKFAEGTELKAGEVTLYKVEVPENKTLKIAAGAKAILDADGTYSGTISNEGSLKIAASLRINKINNVDGKTTDVEFAETTEFDADEATASAYIHEFNAPTTLTIAEKDAAGNLVTVTIEDALTIGYGKTVNNNGTLVGTNLTNNGTINNYAKGNINGGTNTNADADNDDETTEQAVINNYGKITTIANDKTDNGSPLIVQQSANANIVAATLDGLIDNTIGGLVTNTADNEVYAVVDGIASTGKLGAQMGLNTLYVKNLTWTSAKLETGVKKLVLDNVNLVGTQADPSNSLAVTTFEMTGGTSERLELTQAETVKIKGVTFSGNLVADAATDADKVDLSGSTFNGTVRFNTLQEVNLKNVTFNGSFKGAVIAKINVLDNFVTTTNEDKTIQITTFGGSVEPISTGLTHLNISRYAQMVVGNNISIGKTGTTAVVNDGSVRNQGAVLGVTDMTSGSNAMWEGRTYNEALPTP